MDGAIGNYLVTADQIQIVPAISVIILIPIIDRCIYPLFGKIRCLDTQLKRIITGGVMAGVAFVISGLLELKLETTYPLVPRSGAAQVRIFNPRDCQVSVVVGNESLVMAPFGIFERNFDTRGNQSIFYNIDLSACGGGGVKRGEGFLMAVEGQARSYVLATTPFFYEDFVNKTTSGNPAIRVLNYNEIKSKVTRVELSGVNYVFETGGSRIDVTPVGEFSPGTYRVIVNGKFVESIVVKIGGVYTLQTHVTDNSTKISLTTVTPPNSVHIAWLLPQYIVISISEVLFSVTGLEFAFTQAPGTMKSILQASWLLTIAFGNLIVVVVAKARLFERQASEFFMFAGLMAVDMLVLAIMGKFYRYRNYDAQSIGSDESLQVIRGPDGESIRLCGFDDETNP
uniref:SLC15A1 protein n=1 Tax=Fopius arisanus TaxID=64838 RepID=A0A0C9QYL3_9HYME